MRKLVFFIAFFFLVFASLAQTQKTIFSNAEKFYKANNFDKALAEYEKLNAKGYSGMDLYYNMGNCYFKLDKLGLAIAYYEKAAKFDPSDNDVVANLRLANAKTEDKINNEQKGLGGWFNRLIHIMAPDTWTKYGVILWIFAFGTFILVRLKFIKRVFEIASWSAILFAVCFFIFGFLHYKSVSQSTKAVVIESTVQVKSSPSENSKNLYILHEGAKVNLHQVRDLWYEISIDNDNYGWVMKSEAEII
jgi:tetratricopeptide (TPR) repeat protein